MPTIFLSPSAGIDTRISQANPTFNYGTSPSLEVSGQTGINQKSIIQFDLSSIPANAFIQSAYLGLYLYATTPASGSNWIYVHRAFTQWYQGSQNGAAPTAGQNGSTWNLRNANGSLAWAGGAGATAGSDYTPGEVASFFVSYNTLNYYQTNVTNDVINFIDGLYPNYGWWIRTNSSTHTYSFRSSNYFVTNPNQIPYLAITYVLPLMNGSTAGVASLTGTLKGRVSISGEAEGSSSIYAKLNQPGAMTGSVAGTSTAAATLRARGYLPSGSTAGTTTIVATGGLAASGNLASGLASGSTTLTGDIVGRKSIFGTTAGQTTWSASITMVGFLRGSTHGSTTLTGTAWSRATGKASLQICESTPLLYITDGSYLANGQLDRLDLLSTQSGFLLREWNPALAQYKSGGYFSDSATGNGRRLSRRVFENAIEVMSVALKGHNQDQSIWFTREYLRWQELAADYWTSDWAVRPVYLVARAARETMTRYAIIHVMSMPGLNNPYSQPFFGRGIASPAMNELSLRVEREPWTDLPPGQFETVPISSIRSWTVAGWGV